VFNSLNRRNEQEGTDRPAAVFDLVVDIAQTGDLGAHDWMWRSSITSDEAVGVL
jgi:hypothetical protein